MNNVFRTSDRADVPRGRWERRDGIVTCSLCHMPLGKFCVKDMAGREHWFCAQTNYCGNCGARLLDGGPVIAEIGD